MKPSPEDIIQAIYDTAEKALRMRAGVPEHHNGTVTATAEAVTFGGKSRRVVLRNAQPGKSLMVSFDGGTSFITVPPDETLDVECAVDGLVLKSDDGDVDYEGLVIV